MAEFIVFTEEQKKEFSAWVYDRPPIIQEMAAKYPPNRLYRLKSGSGKLRVIIRSYEENETVTVSVTGEYNL